MLSMKNWHGNWLERVFDVLDMLFFCIATLCGIRFPLRATKFHSPLAWYFHIQTYVWKGAVKGNEPWNAPFYLLSRKISATEIAFHWNEVYVDWFTNLVLIVKFQTLGNTEAQNFQMRRKNCMPDHGLPPAPLPSSHTYTFLWKLVDPHKS